MAARRAAQLAGGPSRRHGHDFARLRVVPGSTPSALEITRPDDPSELEAEQAADEVLRSPAPEQGTVGWSVEPAGPATGGLPLADAVRSFFEPRFGRDFGQVRVYTGTEAARSASSIDADAYTFGSAIVFGAGQYAPHTSAGRRLLAHELTHVIQQGGAAGLGHRAGCTTPVVQRQAPRRPPEFRLDPCIIVLGRSLCGQAAADVCRSIRSIPGCDLVCKVFDCSKPKEPTTLCPPGWHAATASGFEGQCCRGEIHSAQNCCPPSRIAISPIGDRCCGPDEVVAGNTCIKGRDLPPLPPPLCPPNQMTVLGECCGPPLVPKGLVCGLPDKPSPVPPLPTPAPVTDVHIDFKLDHPDVSEPGAPLAWVTTSEGRASFASLVRQLNADPAAKVQLVGRASPEGTDEYNLQLGARRARAVAKALRDAGIAASRIADPPGAALSSGCQAVETGLATCGKAGATGASDREVVVHVFGGASP